MTQPRARHLEHVSPPAHVALSVTYLKIACEGRGGEMRMRESRRRPWVGEGSQP